MKNTLRNHLLRLTGFLALASAAWAADRIELTDGSVVYGKLVSVEDGKFKVETVFAGKIVIAQDKIKSFTTDEAVNVTLAAGGTALGRVEPAAGGLQVVAAGGVRPTPTGGVTSMWRVGDDSPETRAAKAAAEKAARRWKFETTLALSGRTGGSEKFGGTLGFKATLASSRDKLILTAAAEQAEDNGVETANRQLAGADYSSFYSKLNVWYARTSLEMDSTKSLDLRSTSAFGLGHKFIKREKQDLEVRIGASYTSESYASGKSFESPGLDVAVIHSLTLQQGKLHNSVTYTPAFKDFANYRIRHETTFELPLTAALWKLKMGVANDFISLPQPGVERLDTLYFTSLILSWD